MEVEQIPECFHAAGGSVGDLQPSALEGHREAARCFASLGVVTSGRLDLLDGAPILGAVECLGCGVQEATDGSVVRYWVPSVIETKRFAARLPLLFGAFVPQACESEGPQIPCFAVEFEWVEKSDVLQTRYTPWATAVARIRPNPQACPA